MAFAQRPPSPLIVEGRHNRIDLPANAHLSNEWLACWGQRSAARSSNGREEGVVINAVGRVDSGDSGGGGGVVEGECQRHMEHWVGRRALLELYMSVRAET